jgi:hypothetical protein
MTSLKGLLEERAILHETRGILDENTKGMTHLARSIEQQNEYLLRVLAQVKAADVKAANPDWDRETAEIAALKDEFEKGMAELNKSIKG